MKIRVICDCGKKLVAPDQLAGKKTKCPACGAVIRLPRLEEVSEQPAGFLWNDTGVDLTSAKIGDILGQNRQSINESADEQKTTCPPPLESTQVSLPVPVTIPPMSHPAPSVKVDQTLRVIVGVIAVLIAVFVVLPFIFGSRREPKTVELADRRELKTEEIVARSEAAVAFIQGVRSSGSGFLISKGLVITNAHVLDDEFMENVEIHFPSATANDKGPFKAQLVYEDSKRDLAIVLIDSNATPLKLSEAFEFRRGQDITVIGSPGVGGHVLKNAISRGVMSTETEMNSQKFYQLGIAINSGNSGGPVFDSYGDVVGVVTARASEQEGLAFSVPLSDVRSVLAIASQSGDVEAKRSTSLHQVAVLSRRIASASRIMLVATNAYKDEVEIAINRRRLSRIRINGQEALGLEDADDLLREIVGSANSRVGESGACVFAEKIMADQYLSNEVRVCFATLWTNYIEIKDYVVSQRGTYDTSRVTTMQMEDQYKRAVKALRVSLGLTGL